MALVLQYLLCSEMLQEPYCSVRWINHNFNMADVVTMVGTFWLWQMVCHIVPRCYMAILVYFISSFDNTWDPLTAVPYGIYDSSS